MQNKFSWKYDNRNIEWDKLSELYRIAPLGEKSAKHLKTVFANSMYVCFLFYDQLLVGTGRAIADGADCSYLCDIAVHPDFQNKGLGKSIVKKLLEFSEGHNKIILYSTPGKEGLYQKFGFRKMNTAMAIFSNNEKAMKEGLLSISD